MRFSVSRTLHVQRIDRGALALDLAKEMYFEINHTGVIVLDQLHAGISIDDIVVDIAKRFDHDLQMVRRDVLMNISQLHEMGLVTYDDAP